MLSTAAKQSHSPLRAVQAPARRNWQVSGCHSAADMYSRSFGRLGVGGGRRSTAESVGRLGVGRGRQSRGASGIGQPIEVECRGDRRDGREALRRQLRVRSARRQICGKFPRALPPLLISSPKSIAAWSVTPSRRARTVVRVRQEGLEHVASLAEHAGLVCARPGERLDRPAVFISP